MVAVLKPTSMQVFSKGSEVKLVETLAEIGDQANGWTAVSFAFARLMDQYRNDYQIKIAVNMVTDLLKSEEAMLFVMADQAINLLAKNTQRSKIDKVIFQLRYLFMDDPLAYTAEGEENPEFCTIYDLGTQREAFSTFARGKMLEGRRGASGAGAQAPAAPTASAPAPSKQGGGILRQVKEQIASASPMKFFNATSLASIERDLANADLSMVVRRQPVCAAIPDMMVRRVFDELYINITHLRQMMRVDADLLSNRWLFKYLTELLDERMLKMVQMNPSRFLDLPVSINLNIKTLLSDFFSEFDATVKPSVKVSVVVEIQLSDVFEDMRAFAAVRNSLQKMGYRICLDGVTDLSFPLVDREQLGFDLIKLQWNADMPSELNSTPNLRIAEAVNRCGPNRVILSRCDNRKAVDYGQALGISLFQGRYLDKLMNPLSKVEN